MSEHGDLTQRAAQIIRDELRALSTEAELSEEQVRAVGAAMIRVFEGGVRVAAAEVSAHAIEQGLDIVLDLRFTNERES